MKIGKTLKLETYGESHAPCIGMRLEGLPAGIAVDRDELQAFMERRAPGRTEVGHGTASAEDGRRMAGAQRGLFDRTADETPADDCDVHGILSDQARPCWRRSAAEVGFRPRKRMKTS